MININYKKVQWLLGELKQNNETKSNCNNLKLLRTSAYKNIYSSWISEQCCFYDQYLLHRESRLLRLQVKLVREGKLQLYQRKAAKSTRGASFKLWNQYVAGTRSTSKLLKAWGKIYAPVVEAISHIEALDVSIVPDNVKSPFS